MAEPLDTKVAEAIYITRVMERALHGSGVWTMVWGPHEAVAEREVTDDRIVFRATFPAHCYLVEPEPVVSLVEDGIVVALKQMAEHPGDGAFTIEWVLTSSASLFSASA